jgi:predicted nucleic acid-binding protein
VTRAGFAYFDTSVLLKRYFAETGSALARSLLSRYVLVTSAIAPTEAMSAICRRRDTGELSLKSFTQVTRRFYKDRPRWELVEVTQQVLDLAEELVDRQNVRTLDAIHLSSGHMIQAALRQPLRFVTANARQRVVATALSFECIWVGP